VRIEGVWQEGTIPETQRRRVTHGICPDCRERAEEDLDSQVP
jgi:hypothetical protein